VVVAGRPSLAESAAFTVDALAALNAALPDATFLPVLRRGNVHGALDMGLAPGLAPGRVALADCSDYLRSAWGGVPATRGLDAAGMLEAAASGRLRCLVLLGADPLADFPDRDLARRALAGTTVIAVDTFLTDSSRHADVVLAAAGFAEKAGTTTNLEGRVSSLTQKVTPRGTSRADWAIAAELASRLGADFAFSSVDDVTAEIARVAPSHATVTPEALRSHRDGVVAAGQLMVDVVDAATQAPVPNAYDHRLVVNRKLYDAGAAVAQSPSLAALAPGAALTLHPLDLDRLGVAAGASVKVISPRTTITMPVQSSTTVPRGIAWVAFNQPNVAIADMLDVDEAITDVRVETLR
ncbi:MAG TPA: molybdopterin-dependent oxidoreductase, partial [Acidimicrobiales bacterium]